MQSEAVDKVDEGHGLDLRAMPLEQQVFAALVCAALVVVGRNHKLRWRQCIQIEHLIVELLK
jgi:hypothetical protein